MVHFLLCGHGSFGSSLLESLEMLMPEVENVSVIDFHKKMDTTDLSASISKTLEELKDRPLLIICDIVGGSPFKLCAMESVNRPDTVVVAGINLASVMEIYFSRHESLSDIVQKVISATKESIDYFPKV